MYGWRGRIGVLIASGSATVEGEFWRVVPEGVSVHFQRLPMARAVSLKYVAEMNRSIEEGAKMLVPAGVDLIIYAYTAAGTLQGPDYHKELIRRMEDASGVRCSTSATAVLEALRALKMKKVCIASAWTPEYDERIKAFFEGNGYEVILGKNLGQNDIALHNRHPPSVAYRLAKEANTPDADGVLIPGNGVRTIDVLGALELDLKKPVVSSGQATIWHALRMIRVNDKIKGFGSLLEK